MAQIRYLKNKQIDRGKWDYCIENALNCRVYAMSWYLDCVCEHWDGLVYGNYEAVMPLPWKRKLGLRYIYHPWFAQQLGCYSQINEIPGFNEFNRKIPIHFIFRSFQINNFNTINFHKDKRIRTNYVLSLQKPYEQILSGYHGKTRASINKAIKLYHQYIVDIPVESLILLEQRVNTSNLENDNSITLLRLMKETLNCGYGFAKGIYNSNKELISGAFFIHFNNRIYYLFSCSNNEGKQKKSMFLILNSIFKQYANTKTIFDFEGSMIPGVERFFKRFGAVTESYLYLHKHMFLRRDAGNLAQMAAFITYSKLFAFIQ